MKLTALLALSLLVAVPTGAGATPVPIVNPGFEAPYLGSEVPTGAFPTGPAPDGWTRYDLGGVPVAGSLLGVLNPGTQADYDADSGTSQPCFPAGAPEGDNVALLFKSGAAAADEYGIEQTLTSLLAADTHYELSVEVGNIQTCGALNANFDFDLEGFPGYRIEVRAGGELLASDDDGLSPLEGEFETSSISFTTGPSPPQEGQALVIRLVALNQATGGGNLEVDFDDVRLHATPVAPAPLPWLALLPLMAGIGAAASRTLRTRR